jgi:tetratricopeptide (TPR) repeat protein
MPGVSVLGQTQDSSSQADALSLWQARHAVITASKYAFLRIPAGRHFKVNSSSIVLTLDSIEFDATYNANSKNSETKHFLIDLKDIKRVSTKCYDDNSGCWLTTESGTDYTIQDKDKEAVWYQFRFGENSVDYAESMLTAVRFASALNSLHAFALTHPAGSGDFHQQAAAWRALTTKPALAEGARILRLAAEDAIKRQKPDEALNDFELGVEADPTWAQGWFNAALLAGELGFFADAADHMQNYLELMPNAADAQSARDQIDLWKYKAGQSPAVVK